MRNEAFYAQTQSPDTPLRHIAPLVGNKDMRRIPVTTTQFVSVPLVSAPASSQSAVPPPPDEPQNSCFVVVFVASLRIPPHTVQSSVES